MNKTAYLSLVEERIVNSVEAEQLDAVLDTLDTLHSLISDGDNVQGLNPRELTNYLRDVIYMAEQTIQELQQRRVAPVLRLVEPTEYQKIS